MAQTGKSEAMAEIEVLRTIWPGTQLAYEVGQERIRAMRDRAVRTLGFKFDLRSFHEALLSWGSLPLDILERRVDECLREPDCSVAFK